MRTVKTLAGAIALGTAVLLVSPKEAGGYSLLGHSLGQGQRDFRVFNNFDNNAANNNQTPDPNYPGYFGATMAIWKGCVEWASEKHGTDGAIGDGGANFDPSFQGEDNDNGGSFGNTHAEIATEDPGVFAYHVGPGPGWRIRYHTNWTWADGPGSIGGNQVDIQGVACHEYGHALGLDHSNSGAATMFFAISQGSTAARSINSDDQAGIQAIYGAASPTKPSIDSLAYDDQLNELTITGVNFAATGNEVWFTQAAVGGNGEPIKVQNLASAAGGTEITLTVPIAAGPGDVLVRTTSGGAGLSNPYPLDPTAATPTGPIITSVDPVNLEALYATNDQNITLTGSGFNAATAVSVDGVPLSTFPLQFTVVDDNTLTLEMPLIDTLGPVEIAVTTSIGTGTTIIDVVAPSDHVLRLGGGNDPETMNSLAPHELRMGGQPGSVAFLWISGSNSPTPALPYFELDIGNFATNLFLMGIFTIEPKGWTEGLFQFSGLPFFTPIYWQSTEYDPVSMTLPAKVSNGSEGLWTF